MKLHVVVAPRFISPRQVSAVAVRSLAQHTITTPDRPILSVHVAPSHTAFCRFSEIQRHLAMRILPIESFDGCMTGLEAVLRGGLRTEDAGRFFEDVIEAATRYLPPRRSPDPRVEKVVALLRKNVDYPLEELAAAVHMSYHWLSHAFSLQVGLSIRNFQTWQRLDRGLRLLFGKKLLTDVAREAGFTDVSHLYRVFQEEFGFGPAFFRSGQAEIQNAMSEYPPASEV